METDFNLNLDAVPNELKLILEIVNAEDIE